MKKHLSFLSALLAFTGSVWAADPAVPKYPTTDCVVSGEPLDSMGGPFVFTYQDTEVKLCCKSCRKKFDKEPAVYLKKLESYRKGS